MHGFHRLQICIVLICCKFVQFSSTAKGPKVSKGRSESPLVASAEAKSPTKRKKKVKTLSFAIHKKSVSCGRFRPPAGGRGTFPHGKVPKGCRGRPKGACLMAAPGPPVAKLQCTASLAGARPAGFTSVPGRATVAFGAADPSPGSPTPDCPWSVGMGPPRQGHLAAVRAPASGPCKVHTRRGTRLVAGSRPNQMACPIRTLSVERQEDVPLPVQGGSGGIPRPFEGGIGGPGGHRGEVGIPPAPLAGGAIPQKKSHVTKAKTSFPRRGAHASENLSFKSYIQRELSNKFAMRKGRHEQRGGPLAHELPGFTPGVF